MDKQQGPIVPHRELYTLSRNKPYGKEKKILQTEKKMLLLRWHKVLQEAPAVPATSPPHLLECGNNELDLKHTFPGSLKGFHRPGPAVFQDRDNWRWVSHALGVTDNLCIAQQSASPPLPSLTLKCLWNHRLPCRPECHHLDPCSQHRSLPIAIVPAAAVTWRRFSATRSSQAHTQALGLTVRLSLLDRDDPSASLPGYSRDNEEGSRIFLW